jgi:hypothetical protein
MSYPKAGCTCTTPPRRADKSFVEWWNCLLVCIQAFQRGVILVANAGILGCHYRSSTAVVPGGHLSGDVLRRQLDVRPARAMLVGT